MVSGRACGGDGSGFCVSGGHGVVIPIDVLQSTLGYDTRICSGGHLLIRGRDRSMSVSINRGGTCLGKSRMSVSSTLGRIENRVIIDLRSLSGLLNCDYDFSVTDGAVATSSGSASTVIPTSCSLERHSQMSAVCGRNSCNAY